MPQVTLLLLYHGSNNSLNTNLPSLFPDSPVFHIFVFLDHSFLASIVFMNCLLQPASPLVVRTTRK